ncbi:ROK family transcriptional regulator [Maritalea sp. S77]|uniref:ROK family transcriptional regulator n=1 Tax=Maritalea sp. S77 TaxID=3415125 RepID=UPI003C7D1694
MASKSTTGIIGGNALRNRDHNQKVVLDYVRANEPAGRAEIARSCGLSIQAVSNITADLEQQKLLMPDGHKTGVRGKPALQYRFNPEGAFAIGAELRPDAIIVAALNLSGEQIYFERMPLIDAHPDPAIKAVGDQVRLALSTVKFDPASLLGVGVVMPGPFGDTAISSAGEAVLPDWEDIDPQAAFEAEIGYPVLIENDATAAAVCERVAGVASEMDDFCYVYFGTGIGLGVISKGHVMRGAFGNAGEIGHIVTQINGRDCPCGNKGCLETYASRFAARQHLAQFGIEANSGEDFARLVADGNEHFLAWLDVAAQHLAHAIGTLENIFDPQTIILGGALPDAVINALIDRLNLPNGSVANREERKCPRVMRGFSGRLTAALGAGAMVIHQTITPHTNSY